MTIISLVADSDRINLRICRDTHICKNSLHVPWSYLLSVRATYLAEPKTQSSVMKTASHQTAISRPQMPGLKCAQSNFTREDHSVESNRQLMTIDSPTNSLPTYKDNESYYRHVPIELRRKIWGNEYVNMWEVLAEYRLSKEKVVVSKETGQARIKRKAIKIDSLSKWIEAFGIYTAVYLIGRPHLGPHLM